MLRKTRLAALALALAASAAVAVAQEQPYASETDDYTLELPSQVWKALPRTDGTHQHTDYVNGERSDGYLRVRRGVIEGGTSLAEYARTEADTKLRFMPGYVVGGKETPFTGRLAGIITTYEYTNAGKPMAGRIYYLKADERTVFVLHFQGARERLQRIQNQTDAIARSFKPKQ
jgi:opacity protein-like surface antigen